MLSTKLKLILIEFDTLLSQIIFFLEFVPIIKACMILSRVFHSESSFGYINLFFPITIYTEFSQSSKKKLIVGLETFHSIVVYLK